MDTRTFAPFTRWAAAVLSHRASLLTFGGAPLAAAAARPDISAAKKKSGADCKKKEKQRCTNDTTACRATAAANCESEDGCPELLSCCDTCTADGFLACVLAAIAG